MQTTARASNEQHRLVFFVAAWAREGNYCNVVDHRIGTPSAHHWEIIRFAAAFEPYLAVANDPRFFFYEKVLAIHDRHRF